MIETIRAIVEMTHEYITEAISMAQTLGITFKEMLESGMVKWEDLISVYAPKLLPGDITHELIVVGHFYEDHILKYADHPVTKMSGAPGFWDVWVGEREEVGMDVLEDLESEEGDQQRDGAIGVHA